MTVLPEKQMLFAALLGKLLVHITGTDGYGVTMAEGYVGDSINKISEDTPHLRRGLHFLRLAQDLCLWKDGVLQEGTEAHRPFGEWWELQHPACRWGGRWNDGGHYSVTHGGFA